MSRLALRRRIGAALVAYACLATQISSLAHRILVQHATCSEHGEAIHLRAASPDGVRDPGFAPASSATHSDREAGARASLPMAEGDEHEHCCQVVFRNPRPPSSQGFTIGPIAAGARVPHPRPVALSSGVAAYLIAPKTSPPRSA